MKTRYIPAGAIKVSDKLSDAVAYIYSSKGSPCGRVYYGKQSKPILAYRFRSEAERTKYIKIAFEGRQARIAREAARAAERKAWVNDYKVGEILNTCWGYDQTNKEFYEIIAVKGSMVTLRQLAVESFSTGDMSDRVTPLPGSYVGEAFKKRAQHRGIKINQVAYAFRTDYTESVPGVKVYGTHHTSCWA